MNIKPFFDIGDVFLNKEKSGIYFLTDKKFLSVTSYSYQECKKMFGSNAAPYLDCWYYAFKITHKSKMFNNTKTEWLTEYEIQRRLLDNDWTFYPVKRSY